MKTGFAKGINARKKQILKRLATARANRFTRCFLNPNPVLASNSVKYELAEFTQAINYAVVTAMLNIAEHVGLTDAINNHVHLLKWHAPYHETDHVLAMVMNVLCNGSRLEHMDHFEMILHFYLRLTPIQFLIQRPHATFPWIQTIRDRCSDEAVD